MILASISDPTTYAALAKKLPVLEEALAWIQSEGKIKEPGKYPVPSQICQGSYEGTMTAEVQKVSTKRRSEVSFEAHKRFVDVQFCYEGGEIIEWASASTLDPLDDYNDEKDVRHYRVPGNPKTVLCLKPGTFAVFFPGDAHLPKVSDGINQEVRKVIVKIPISGFE
jgi:biofilm protein TabA